MPNHPEFSLFLVEDSDDDLFLFRRLLAKAEIALPLSVATNGQSAIDQISQGLAAGQPPPGVFFIDLKLPLRSGFEVLEWIRNQPSLRESVALILSSSAETRDVKRAYELHADSYLVKYPSPAVFREVIRAVSALRNGTPRENVTFPGVPNS